MECFRVEKFRTFNEMETLEQREHAIAHDRDIVYSGHLIHGNDPTSDIGSRLSVRFTKYRTIGNWLSWLLRLSRDIRTLCVGIDVTRIPMYVRTIHIDIYDCYDIYAYDWWKAINGTVQCYLRLTWLEYVSEMRYIGVAISILKLSRETQLGWNSHNVHWSFVEKRYTLKS